MIQSSENPTVVKVRLVKTIKNPIIVFLIELIMEPPIRSVFILISILLRFAILIYVFAAAQGLLRTITSLILSKIGVA